MPPPDIIPNPHPPSPSPKSKQIHYTVFVRLPFSRASFQDPAPSEWDSTKDKALWKLISKASNSRDLDWESTAEKFGVELSFLMQQAAWLYERHFAGMRAQMQKLAVTGSAGSSTPVAGPGEGSVGSQRAKDSRAPSAQAVRKDSPLPPGELGSQPGTPRLGAPPFSRTPSTGTITQSRVSIGSFRQQPLNRNLRTSNGSQQSRRPASPLKPAVESSQASSVFAQQDKEDEQSESEESEEEPPMARSQAFRRPPIRSKRPTTLGTLISSGDVDGADEEDEDSSSGGLPFAAPFKAGRSEDPSATLTGAPKRHATATAQGAAGSGKGKAKRDVTASSSASSASSAQPPASSEGSSRILTHDSQAKPGPLSPKHRAQLTQMSPRHGREGSEGTPSMGSSYSDLDDTSVTQSAMEDALLSMQHQGGASIASRMSNISSAFRSRQL